MDSRHDVGVVVAVADLLNLVVVQVAIFVEYELVSGVVYCGVFHPHAGKQEELVGEITAVHCVSRGDRFVGSKITWEILINNIFFFEQCWVVKIKASKEICIGEIAVHIVAS